MKTIGLTYPKETVKVQSPEVAPKVDALKAEEPKKVVAKKSK